MPQAGDATPIYRDGKVVLKMSHHANGDITLYKPFVIDDRRIMESTGAPGWDKDLVDKAFTGRNGELHWNYEGRQFSIKWSEFREHAFVRDFGFGQQYHVHRKFWTEKIIPKVSPLRGEALARTVPPIPAKIAFGSVKPCPQCHGQRQRAVNCAVCGGRGVVNA